MQLVELIGKERLVIDLSCRKKPGVYGNFDSHFSFSRIGSALDHLTDTVQNALLSAHADLDADCCSPSDRYPRRFRDGWYVAINRWQTTTDLELSKATLERLVFSFWA